MCSVFDFEDESFEPISLAVGRLVSALTVNGVAITDRGREEEAEPMIAIAPTGPTGGETSRADGYAGEGATVYEFSARKGPAAETAGQFIRGGNTVAERMNATRQPVSLRVRR